MANTDRYIVDKSCYNELYSHHLLQNKPSDETISYREQKKRKHLSYLLHGFQIDRMKVLNQRAQSRLIPNSELLRTLGKVPRKVKSKPDRILEAPNIINDYYTFGIDWGQQDTLAVALDTGIYTWNTKTNKTQLLADYPAQNGAYISCVAWKPQSSHIAVTSTCSEYVDLWDEPEEAMIHKLSTQYHQIISMSWNDHLLSCGTISGNILHYDVRLASEQPILINRAGDVVCGLKWSPDGLYLASGSNNTVKIWDLRQMGGKRFLLNNQCHSSAVKALAWCPWESNILASGGGICDQTIKIWSSMNGKEKANVKTASQVTAILWSKQYRELITSHGKQECSLQLWEYPDLNRIAELKMHDERILSAVLSPDETCVAAASADETISIWNCFPRNKKQEARCGKPRDTSLQFAMFHSIR